MQFQNTKSNYFRAFYVDFPEKMKPAFEKIEGAIGADSRTKMHNIYYAFIAAKMPNAQNFYQEQIEAISRNKTLGLFMDEK